MWLIEKTIATAYAVLIATNGFKFIQGINPLNVNFQCFQIADIQPYFIVFILIK